MGPSHPLLFLTPGTPLLVWKILSGLSQGGDGAGELCGKSSLLGLFCSTQKASAVPERTQAWNTAGPRGPLPPPLFFTLPSFLGSAGRTLRRFPTAGETEKGVVTP